LPSPELTDVKPNPNLTDIHRTPEDMRGRERFVRLDRNERVTAFSGTEFTGMLATLGPEAFCSYPDPSPLVDRLASSLQMPPEWICLTNGSDAAIRKIFQTFIRPGDSVLLAEPTYAMYPIYTRMFGARADLVSYRADRTLDVLDFRNRLASGPRIAALACPDQPTGAVLTVHQLRSIVDAAARNDVLCIIDEAYHPFHPATAVDLVREFDNLVITRTFSKVGGLAGLRLGYFVASAPLVELVDRVRGAHEVNAVAIHVGCFVVDHPEVGERYMREVEAGRALLKELATEVGFGFPSSPANFQLIELPAGLEPRAVVSGLKDRGYLVKGAFDHPSVNRCIRITLAGPDVVRPFVHAMREVCERADV
jgi:histidinol-phosphate aminotransferase